MIKTLIIGAFCILAISAGKPKYHELEGYNYQQYVKDFDKPHMLGSSEYTSREQIFNSNLADIKAHNEAGHSWFKGVNKFTDITDDEFVNTYFGNDKNIRQGYEAQQKKASRFLERKEQRQSVSVPEAHDWRDYGVVTAVKDQGACGSCWAFSSTETIESQAAVATGKLMTLSPQQLTSCVTNGLQCGGTGGCAGSVPQIAFTYVELFGMTTSAEYPYSAANGDAGVCGFDKETMSTSVLIEGHETLPLNEEAPLLEALIRDGPISVSVWASPWKSYEHGIFTGCSFEENIVINHAVQLVGYTEDAYIVRNSWSDDWGEDGYIRLERTAVTKCGVDSSPLWGIACVNGGETTQVACGQCGVLFNSATTIRPRVLN